MLHVWSVGPGRFSELWAASFPSGSIGGVPFSRQLPWAAQLPGHVSFQGCDEMTGKLAMISLFSVIFSSFHHEGKVHIAAMQQPPLPVLLSPAGAKQGHPLTLVSCMGSNSGSHQEGIRVPAPFSRSSFLTLGWGVPSICPALPRESSAQVALGPQSPSMPLPRTFHPACFSPCWLPAKLGRCSGGGPQQTGWGQKDVDRGWCRLEWAGVCPGRQEESKGQSKAEGMRLGPCQDMGWERDGHKALGQG